MQDGQPSGIPEQPEQLRRLDVRVATGHPLPGHTDLVVHGPFRYARNPIFSAMLITACGLAMTIPNVVSIVGLLSLIAALQVQVRLVEEPYLLATHGDVYRSYARVVGRFSPGMGHLD